ncbi:MAG: hypothetical protein JW947_01170 [Sedimentisphaerales bacterium]|nr:hypothetical protein [Sedimentisphaerales bacterium]
MLALLMDGTYETKTRWADKIGFFGLFIAVLLIAHFITILRFAVTLSEPIKLNFAGLSVRIPAGNGWRGGGQWKYLRNGFSLESFFTPGSGIVAATVSLQYLLAAKTTTPEELFKEKASAIGGAEIAITGQIDVAGSAEDREKGSNSVLKWAHIKKPNTLFEMFFGVLQLPNNRRLDIEVYQAASEEDLAEKIFKSVAASLRFTDNKLLDAGGKIVAEIKGRGVDSFLDSGGERVREDFFLIKDGAGQTIGFTMEAISSGFLEAARNGGESAPEAQLNISAGNVYYVRGRYEQRTFFQSDNSFNEFVWRSEIVGPGGRSGTETVLGKDGIMTIREFGWQARERDCQISPAATPDVLGEFIFGQMLDSGQKEVLVDIIDADGRIIPALVSAIDAPRPFVSQGKGDKAEEAAYAFRVELLDGQGFSEQVYLDAGRRVSRRLLQQENAYTLERAAAEDILKMFPERGSYILRREEGIMESSQPSGKVE